MQAENNNDIAITEAKLKDFLSSVLSSEGIVVDIRRTFIEYNGVNRSRVFARHANRMACKGSNEKPAPEPPAKKEAAPKPARMESDQNGNKDKTPSDTENPVNVNAFTKQENPVRVEEKPAPKQKPAKASKAKTPKTPESGTSKPATAPAPAPAKKPEADNRNDASLFGRGFQNRTTKGSGSGKKKANQSKKPGPYSEGEQMRFDGI